MKGSSLLAAGLLISLATAFAPARSPLRLFLIGDSTVMTYKASDSPMTGWGQRIGWFFGEGTVTVINRAIGGRSSRSFIEEGRWNTVRDELAAGDFLFIQFGHNDRSTVAERHADTAQYRRYLTQYVDESRARGAIPILVSPMNLNAWNGTTLRRVFTEGANDYRAAMLRVVTARKVPFIDLEKKSAELFQSLGRDYLSRFLFLTLMPGEYPNYPEGLNDGTHFQEMGALEMARLVAEGIRDLAADTLVKALAENLVQLQPLTVVSNKPSGGTVTRSRSYPPKAPIVLKAIPASGETFLGWAPSTAANPESTGARMDLAMPASPVTYRAFFRGGSVGLAPERSAVGAAPGPEMPGRSFRDALGQVRDASGRAVPVE